MYPVRLFFLLLQHIPKLIGDYKAKLSDFAISCLCIVMKVDSVGEINRVVGLVGYDAICSQPARENRNLPELSVLLDVSVICRQ